MSSVSKSLLADVLNVKKVTERHILKVVRVRLNNKIREARQDSRNILDVEIIAARTKFRNAILNRAAGETTEQAMKSSDLEANLRNLRSKAAADLDATLEEIRSNSNDALAELLVRFDSGEFHTSHINRRVEDSVEV